MSVRFTPESELAVERKLKAGAETAQNKLQTEINPKNMVRLLKDAQQTPLVDHISPELQIPVTYIESAPEKIPVNEIISHEESVALEGLKRQLEAQAPQEQIAA